LAHSKSALKRWRQSLARRDRNRSVKSRTRTMIGKAMSALGTEPASSEEAVKAAISAIDRTAQKGVIHPNAAARAKSRLLKKFNLAQAQAVAAAASTPPPATESEPPARPARRTRARTDQPAGDTPPAPRRRPRASS
jgi:small subunit ribosomal protein S20